MEGVTKEVWPFRTACCPARGNAAQTRSCLQASPEEVLKLHRLQTGFRQAVPCNSLLDCFETLSLETLLWASTRRKTESSHLQRSSSCLHVSRDDVMYNEAFLSIPNIL
jgi:hypothetical protein